MFKFFENLVDPYCAYPASDHPPQRLWPFLLAYAQPFKRVFAVAAVDGEWWDGRVLERQKVRNYSLLGSIRRSDL